MEHGGLVLGREEESMDLPPGFRFHPTNEELITHYLCNKVLDSGISARAIGNVDLNKCEPWDLPWRAKMGEEWYIFCLRDRKYPTGLRINQATEAGYWKSTPAGRAMAAAAAAAAAAADIGGGREVLAGEAVLEGYLGYLGV